MVKIICEGVGDVKNIKKVLDFFNIEYIDDMFIYTNGKSFLVNSKSEVYDTLKKQLEIGQVDKILIIADVDDSKNDEKLCGEKNTISKIEKLQEELNIQGKSDYFLACDPQTRKGYFESLLLSTVDEEVKKCYEEFRICSGLNSKATDKNIMSELHNLTKPDKPYDFNHQNFDELKEKLIKLFEN